MARLHGFPDWFRLHETKWHGARQVGNAVPPPMARYVGASVMAAIGLSPEMPDRSVKLGNAALVGLSMKNAAELFGRSFEPLRRDRKSGATKRKQHEIEAARALSGT